MQTATKDNNGILSQDGYGDYTQPTKSAHTYA
jgi:hypothetical protein